MKLFQIWRGLCLLALAVLLTGCIPHADFTVTPQPLSVGQQGTFDASGSSAFLASQGNTLVSYAWDFGDGTKATGKVATHTYAQSGDYRVRLTVKDTQGFSDTRQLLLKVGEAAGEGQAEVLVLSAEGVLLSGAEVVIGGVTASSGIEGVANLMGIPSGKQVVVVRKAGFVTQAQELDVLSEGKTGAQVRLQPVKEVLDIADISAAQAILGRTLGAQITLPANAFVDANGNPAVGAVKLMWTPWDITGDDLQAMPGNGQAIGADGQRTTLISAGMMTVDFIDAQGRHLQLAAGKLATIRMDLPFTRINGIDLQVGSEIPMWTFDEALGLWKEDGIGYVVSSPSSSTGLAVEAKVAHFSTWNWDFKMGGSNTLNVRCVDANGQAVACSVTATVELEGGGRLTKSSYVPASGVNIINMPSDGTVNWRAVSADGLVGTASSGLSGSVVIQIEAALTSNFVQCQRGGESLACTVLLSAVVDGQPVTRTVYLPAGGATVKTGWNTSSLSWQGESGLVLNGSNWERYSGSTTSGVTGEVSLSLTEVTTTPVDRLFRIRCEAEEPVPGVDSCDLLINIYSNESETSLDLTFNNVPLGDVVSFNVPTDQYSYMAIQGTYPSEPNYAGWSGVGNLSEYSGDVIVVWIGLPR